MTNGAFTTHLRSFIGKPYKQFSYIKNDAKCLDCIGFVAAVFSNVTGDFNHIIIEREMYMNMPVGVDSIISNMKDFEFVNDNDDRRIGDILYFEMPRRRPHLAIISCVEDCINIIHARSDVGVVCENILDNHLQKYLRNIIRCIKL